MSDWDTPDPNLASLPTYAGPAPGFVETFKAARQQYDAQSLSTARDYYAGRLGREVVSALRAKGRKGIVTPDGRTVRYGDDALRRDYVLNPAVAPRIWADVAAERERDPKFLADMPDAEAFDRAIITARQRDYRQSREVLGRATGVAGLTTELLGGAAAAFEDPLQIGAMAATAVLPWARGGAMIAERLFGGKLAMAPARRIAGAAIGGAAGNVAATAPTLPIMAERSAEIGVEFGTREAAMHLAAAGVLGGVLEGAGAALGVAWKAASARRLARDLQAKADAGEPLTLPERDALAVLETASIDIASSPYPPTPAGDAAHAERLTEAVTALETDRAIDPAPFETDAPVPRFDPTPFMVTLRRLMQNDRKMKPDPATIGAMFGRDAVAGRDILLALANSKNGRALVLLGKNGFRRPPQRQGAVDLLTQIADLGGLKPSGVENQNLTLGHDLAGTLGQRLIPGAGMLLRKNGMTIGELTERLAEAGWFPGRSTGDVTEADVLDLLRTAYFEKTYHPDDSGAVMDADYQRGADENAQWEAHARQDIDTAAADLGINPPDEAGYQAILNDVARGVEPDVALREHLNSELDALINEARAQIDESDYEAAFFGDENGQGGAGAQDSGGRAVASGDARPGGEAVAGFDRVAAAADEAAAAEALAPFETPQGEGPAVQRESLAHDLRAEVEGVQAPPASKAARSADDIAAARIAFAESGGDVGPHGPIHSELRGDYAAAIERLAADQDGEVPGLLAHPDIGNIDLIYGVAGTNDSDGAGLAKLLRWHPEVVKDLPAIINAMRVRVRSENRIKLESADYRAVIRLDYDGRKKTWLLTAFEKKKDAPGVTQDGPASPLPPGRTNYSGSKRSGDIAPANPLDNGAQTDPAAATRARQLAQLRAEAPMRGRTAQTDLSDTGLFGQTDAFAMPDGSTVSAADLLADIDRDNAALKIIRDCL